MSKNFSIYSFGLIAAVLFSAATIVSAEALLSGSSAINFLQSAAGTNSLSAVASRYGWSTNKLISTLNLDPDLKLRPDGRLVYLCSHQPSSVARSQPKALFPLNQTFLLHSRPGASKTIYLDFDGMVISGTAWNDDFNNGADIVAPPWDIDGNPGSFNAQERAAIQEVWFRVAEDYAPYDVDVTTEFTSEAAITRANLADQVYGTRVLISPIASQIVPAGGVAYLGIFADVGDYFKPALVFPENLGDDAKNIAEAASHEAGHNFNLRHQGQGSQAYFLGQGNWAPIMGAGYYVSVSQWAKGEYQGANNQEDQLAIINSFLNYRPNPFGTNFATATPFFGSNNVTNGIVNTTGLTNFFSFQTGAGMAGITVSNWAIGSDLHLVVGVYNANGVMIANVENPDDATLGTLPVSLNLPVNSGKYYVSVAGKGYLDPLTTGYSAYASLGNYTLIITNTPGGSTFLTAPLPPWGTNLAIMNGGNPNGDWYLFVQDDKPIDVGAINGGWSVSLTSAEPVGYAADNQIYCTPTLANVNLGGNWAVTLAVTNYGPSTSSNVVITSALPLGPGISYVSSATASGSVNLVGSVHTWSIGSLPVGAGATLTLTLKGNAIGIYTNAIAVSAATPDPNPDNDAANAVANVAVLTPPSFASIAFSGGVPTFDVTNTSGAVSVIIQATTNLVPPVNWLSIFTNITPFSFTDSNATNFPVRFYRSVTGP